MSTAGQTLKVHQAIARALSDNGVETLFGVLGEANLFLAHSFVKDCGGAYVAAAHEAGAALMALGYSLLSGSVGVCTVTHGAGMVNTSTPLVEGVKGSVPMLLLCGDTPSCERHHLQHVAQRDFIAAAGAGLELLRSPATVAFDVATALRRALIERRPIALSVPVDFQWCDTVYSPVLVRIPEWRATVSASPDLDDAIGILAASKRPLIIAGRGASSPEAAQSLVALADRIDAPLATTLKAKDLFRDNWRNIGICGTLSTPSAVETILSCDSMIAFGASLNQFTTSNGAYLEGKRVIQVNLEAPEIGKHVEPDAGLVGDPMAVANLIVRWLDEAEVPGSAFWNEPHAVEGGALTDSEPARSAATDGPLDFLEVLACLEASLPSDRILVTDGGRFVRETWKNISVPGPRSFITTTNIGSIGLGLPHAIGASFAAGGRPVVLFIGDGGFMLGGLAEFNTAVRHQVDLIVILCNDTSYGAEYVHLERREMDVGISRFDWPDFAPIAAALGGEGVTVQSMGDLARAGQAINSRRGPILIEIKLDPAHMPEY